MQYDGSTLPLGRRSNKSTETVKTTAKGLAEKMGVEYLMANSLIKLLIHLGQAKNLGTDPNFDGNGRAPTVYEINQRIEIRI